jgi:hypothetical protein
MGKFAKGLSLSRRGFFMGCIVTMAWLLFGTTGCGSQSNDQSRDEAFIKANPNPVATGEGPGKTTISWDTSGKASWGQIYVSPDGKPEKLFAEGERGSKEAPWIQASMTYEFRFYAGTERKTLLDSVEVKGK